jgi:hypothetical protein
MACSPMPSCSRSRAAPGPVLDRLHGALKPSGVLLASNPCGQDEEGLVDGPYACFYSLRSGAGWSAAAALPWSITTTGRPASQATSSHGSLRCGASPHREISAALGQVRRVVRTWCDACDRLAPQVRTLVGLRSRVPLRSSGPRVRRGVRTANPDSRAVASEISPPHGRIGVAAGKDPGDGLHGHAGFTSGRRGLCRSSWWSKSDGVPVSHPPLPDTRSSRS